MIKRYMINATVLAFIGSMIIVCGCSKKEKTQEPENKPEITNTVDGLETTDVERTQEPTEKLQKSEFESLKPFKYTIRIDEEYIKIIDGYNSKIPLPNGYDSEKNRSCCRCPFCEWNVPGEI